MEYKFVIDDFEGPLDVLLFLLKKDNIKIEDIEIEKITEQYLSFIRQMQEINLSIASEYLVLAAELIEMKSNILLPRKKQELEEVIDPRQNLIDRLKEYQLYKEVTNDFKLLENNRKEFFTKEPSLLTEFKKEDEVIETSSIDILVEAFKSFLDKKVALKPLDTKITNKEYSVYKRSKEIKNLIKTKKKLEFTELFNVFNKEYVIVTFLSVLDLTRKQEIEIRQERNFDKIFLIDRGI
ncbi:MAG: segregation/condensation protein A [Firmicutes bacterium]|nr:segregation/condensation protein A [Bacillota bacterium]